MAAPFYVSPEQWYQDKAEYARKGISQGKPIVALEYDGGIVLMAENYSARLRKISEIYDRIAFAGVGKFDEYDSLRKSGVRYADLRGFSFSREDVAARNLANEYSTVLGSIFTREMKPFEVEVLVVEVGDGPEGASAFYQILYNGFIADHQQFAAIGGDAEELRDALRKDWREHMPLVDAVQLGCKALSRASNGSQALGETNLEIAVLDRKQEGRKFRRLTREEIRELVSE